MKHISSLPARPVTRYVTGMVTRIHKHVRPRLFLKEHRKAKGVSAETMGDRIGLERESVHRLEKHPERLSADKQAAYAHALNIEPEDLWHPPGTPSLDGMVKKAPEDVRAMAADIVQRMVAGKGG